MPARTHAFPVPSRRRGLGQLTSGQAAAAASPAAATVLPYAQWVTNTIASYPGTSASAIDTSQAAYNEYLAIHNVTQQERAQGAGPGLDAVLSSMAATPDWYAAQQSAKTSTPNPVFSPTSVPASAMAAPPTPNAPTATGSNIDVTAAPAASPAPAVQTAAPASTGISTTWILVGIGAAALVAYLAFSDKK